MIAFDSKIYKNSRICQDEKSILTEMAKIAAESGVSVAETGIFGGTSECHKRVAEIGFIRMPIKTDPRLLIFRLEISAYFKSERVLMVQNDTASFTFDCHRKEYCLNPKVVSMIDHTFL
jgi:hypothetical protein